MRPNNIWQFTLSEQEKCDPYESKYLTQGIALLTRLSSCITLRYLKAQSTELKSITTRIESNAEVLSWVRSRGYSLDMMTGGMKERHKSIKWSKLEVEWGVGNRQWSIINCINQKFWKRLKSGFIKWYREWRHFNMLHQLVAVAGTSIRLELYNIRLL